MSFIGTDPRFGKGLLSRRLWRQTGRRLEGKFLSVALATRILSSDICPDPRREVSFWKKEKCFSQEVQAGLLYSSQGFVSFYF
jgi:hypothetical protein